MKDRLLNAAKNLATGTEELLLSKEFGWGLLIGSVVLALSYGAQYLFV